MGDKRIGWFTSGLGLHRSLRRVACAPNHAPPSPTAPITQRRNRSSHVSLIYAIPFIEWPLAHRIRRRDGRDKSDPVHFPRLLRLGGERRREEAPAKVPMNVRRSTTRSPDPPAEGVTAASSGRAPWRSAG